jgi:hypothetical protein
MSNSRLKTKFRKEHNHSNTIPFNRKDGQPSYVHDVGAFLKQSARERDDNTVTISDPNSDAGLCSRCDDPAMFEYAYLSPFDDEPQLRAKVVSAFCPEHWREYIIENFIPQIYAHIRDQEEEQS